MTDVYGKKTCTSVLIRIKTNKVKIAKKRFGKPKNVQCDVVGHLNKKKFFSLLILKFDSRPIAKMSRSGSVREKIDFFEETGRREQEEAKASSSRSSRPRRKSPRRPEESDDIERESSPPTTTDEEDMNDTELDSTTPEDEKQKRTEQSLSDSERSPQPSTSAEKGGRTRSRSTSSARSGKKETTKKTKSRNQGKKRAGRMVTRRRPRVRSRGIPAKVTQRAALRGSARIVRRRSQGPIAKKDHFQLSLMAQIKRMKQEEMPDIRITKQCTEVINSLTLGVVEKTAKTAHALALKTKKNSVTLRDVETATWMCLPVDWSKEILKEAKMAMN